MSQAVPICDGAASRIAALGLEENQPARARCKRAERVPAMTSSARSGALWTRKAALDRALFLGEFSPERRISFCFPRGHRPVSMSTYILARAIARWTQAKLAIMFGVDRTTVSLWLTVNISDVKSHKAYKPDARTQVRREDKPLIVETP